MRKREAERKEEETKYVRESLSHAAVGMSEGSLDKTYYRGPSKKRASVGPLEWKAAPTRKLKSPPLDLRSQNGADPLPTAALLEATPLRKRNGMRTSVLQVLQHVAGRRRKV